MHLSNSKLFVYFWAKVILLLQRKSLFDINSTVRNDFSNLFVVMYEIVNKKGENKKCNNRVAWSVQQLRKREEIKCTLLVLIDFCPV